MKEFLLAFDWFIYGFVAGLLTPVLVPFLTKLIKEVKIARQQWHKGPNR